MPLLKKPGTYHATVKLADSAEELFTTSTKGTDGIVLSFTTETGETIQTTLWLSQAAYKNSCDVLERVFKFDGDFKGLASTLAFPNLECEIVVEMEEFTTDKGETRSSPKVKWINSRGAKRSPANVKAVLDRLERMKSGEAPAPRATSTIQDGMEEDDIPF